MFIGTIKAVENKTLDIVLFGQVYFLYIIQKFGVTEIFFCVWKKLILLFIKETLNWLKVTVKTFIMLHIKAVLLNFLLIKESWEIKCITVSTKIWIIPALIIIINQHRDFWRIMWVMMVKITGINYTLLYIKIKKLMI